MILIISEDNDASTSKVIEWLMYYDAPHLRINLEDNIKIVSVTIDDFVLDVNGNIIESSKITSYWLRRGNFNFDNIDFDLPLNFDGDNARRFLARINSQQGYEMSDLSDFLHFILEQKPGIGSRCNCVVNKLKVQKIASDIGFKTPITLITDNFDKALTYFNVGSEVITKPICIPFSFVDNVDKEKYLSYTQKVQLDPGIKFGISLLQKYIDKEYEVRSFYLQGEIYSMAIFSQLDEQTKVDFRKYNHSKPNRWVPLKLPELVEAQIHCLMDKLDMDSGSIDLIKSTENDWFFLEVNPVGQFGMVSYPCNYQIEREIALKLIKYGEN